MRTLSGARIVLTGLLLWGGYWAALPWTDCWNGLPVAIELRLNLMRTCAIGAGTPGPGPEPHLVNIAVAMLFVVSAGWVLGTRGIR